MTTLIENFQMLADMGFIPAPYFTSKVADLDEHYQAITAERETMDTEIDGLVISVPTLDKLAAYGFTTDGKQCPKGQIALKFPATHAEVEILDVEWSAQGGAHLSPVGIITPSYMDGATITRVSLKSYSWLTSYDARLIAARQKLRLQGKDPKLAEGIAGTKGAYVGVGSKVVVARSGGVIPTVVAVTHNTLADDPKIPACCPACGSPIRQNGAFIDCENFECKGKEANRINHFLSKLKVKGLSQTSLEEYAELAAITLADFFTDPTFNNITAKLQGTGISLRIWEKVRRQLLEIVGPAV